MNVSLTPELEQFVRRKVESGLYGNASEVVRDALRLLVGRPRATARALRALCEAGRLRSRIDTATIFGNVGAG